MSKLNKAVATALLALINMLCLPAAKIKRALKALKAVVGKWPQRLVDHIRGPEYVSARPAGVQCLAAYASPLCSAWGNNMGW